MNKLKLGMVCALVIGLGSIGSVSLAAQSMPQGTIEGSGSIGVSGGIGSVDKFTSVTGLISDLTNLAGGPVQFDSGSNTNWNIGLAGGYAVRDNVMVTGELVRTRLVDPKLTIQLASVTNTLSFNSSLLEGTAGVQYSLPLNGSKIAPFGGAGLGIARVHLALENSTFSILDVDSSDTHFTENLGGGVRIYMSPHVGIKPEIKLIHIPNETFVRTAVGIFFQIGS